MGIFGDADTLVVYRGLALHFLLYTRASIGKASAVCHLGWSLLARIFVYGGTVRGRDGFGGVEFL